METRKIKISAIIAVSTVLLSAGFAKAQVDTTRMPMPDSTRINSPTDINTQEDMNKEGIEQEGVEINKETNIYNMEAPTTPAPAAPAPAVTEEDRDEDHRDWWHDDDEKFHPGELGLRYMPTFSKVDIRTYSGDVIEGEITASNGVELIAGINFNRHIGLMAGISYYGLQQKYKDRGLDRQVDLKYIQFPVLLQLNTSKSKPVNFNVVVGPQFGVNVGAEASASDNGDAETVTATVAVKSGDVGLAYGAGLEFALTPDRMLRLDLGFRGMLGLVDVSDRQSGDTYTITIKGARQTYAGYVGLAWAFGGH
jgi:hypothetical protein